MILPLQKNDESKDLGRKFCERRFPALGARKRSAHQQKRYETIQKRSATLQKDMNLALRSNKFMQLAQVKKEATKNAHAQNEHSF